MASELAYGLYNYGVGIGVGEVGRCKFDASTTPTIQHNVTNLTGLTPDPKVFYFLNKDGQPRLLVAETVYDSSYNPLPSEFRILNAATFAQVYPTSGTVQWGYGTATADKLVNVYAFKRNGTDDYIYGIDYDRQTVFRVQNSSGDTYSFDTVNKYYFNTAAAQDYGIDVAVDANNVYALFISATDVWAGSYNSSTVVKLTLALALASTPNTNSTLGKNAFGFAEYGGDLYITSIGGMQQMGFSNGANSKLEKLVKSTMASSVLFVGDNAATTDAAKGDFRDIAIGTGGEVFILTGYYTNSSTGAFDGYLYNTDVTTLNTGTGGFISAAGLDSLAITNFLGYFWSLIYNNSDNMVWFARGNDFAMYKYDVGFTEEGSIGANALASSGTGWSINGAAIYEPVVTTLALKAAPGGVSGGTVRASHPAFASVSQQAFLERKKLLGI